MFAGSGSRRSETTTAAFVMGPGRVGWMSSATAAFVPADIVPRSQDTSLPLRVHAPWLGVAEMKVTPGGMRFVSRTLLAALRLRLVIVRV